jgi:hypothetical protein
MPDAGLLITLVTFPAPKLPGRLVQMGPWPFRTDLAMPNGEQCEVQHQLCMLSQRLEELSAVPAGAGHAGEFVVPFRQKCRFETNLRGQFISSPAKSTRG